MVGSPVSAARSPERDAHECRAGDGPGGAGAGLAGLCWWPCADLHRGSQVSWRNGHEGVPDIQTLEVAPLLLKHLAVPGRAVLVAVRGLLSL